MGKLPSDKLIWIGTGKAPGGFLPDNDVHDVIPKAILVSGEIGIQEALSRLEALRPSRAPWLVMTDTAYTADWLKAGAAGFIPCNTPKGLVHAALARIGEVVDSAEARNPLTNLPGNDEIKKELKEKVLAGGGLACYFDITGFKPFNDYYGFTLGDAVLRGLAEILTETLHGFFVGNVGGDDFVGVCSEEQRDVFRRLVGEGVSKFNRRAPGYYGRGDVQRGGIETLDRTGKMKFFPFMTLTASVVSGKNCSTVAGIAQIAGLEKKRLRGEFQRKTVSSVLCSDGRIPALSDFRKWYATGYSTDDAKALLESAGILNDRKMKNCLCEVLLSGETGDVRKSAARALGKLADTSTADVLLEALKDKNPHIRTLVSDALPYVMGSSAGPHLAGLVNDSSTWVRRAALKGLGMSGWSGAAEQLSKTLKSTKKKTEWARDFRMEKAAALDGAALLGGSLLSEVKDLLDNDQGIPMELVWNAMLTLGADDVVKEAILTIREGNLKYLVTSLERLEHKQISSGIFDEFEIVLAEKLYPGNQYNAKILSFMSNSGEWACECEERGTRPLPAKVQKKLLEMLDEFSGGEIENLIHTITARKIEIPVEQIMRLLNKSGENTLSKNALITLLLCIAVNDTRSINPGVLLNKSLRKKELSREEEVAAARCIVALL